MAATARSAPTVAQSTGPGRNDMTAEWVLNNVLGPVAAIGSWALMVLALWKWGLSGIVERQQALFRRLAHGPAPRERIGPDYAEIARLEVELYGKPQD